MKHATSIYDVVRIDHFRGFESYYSIPAENTTAAGGHWGKKAPDRDFIHAMQQALGGGNIIAEDLGVLDPGGEGDAGRKRLPGHEDHAVCLRQRESGNYLPHTYPRNSVVYTAPTIT